MAYEQQQPYLKTFDREQAPVWMQTLAARAGLGPRQDSRYLDLGCAAGHTTLALAPLYPQMQFVGVDFNSLHIEQAQSEASRLGLGNCHYIQADFRDLPASLEACDLLQVRGIYSWLSPEVRQALEQALDVLGKPHSLLRVHYSVLPGGIMRDSVGEVLKALGGPKLEVAGGKAVVDLLIQQAPALTRNLTNGAKSLELLKAQGEELWVHDILNEDYRAEYASAVFGRLASKGFTHVAATGIERNLPVVLVNNPVLPWLKNWHSGPTQTLLDVFTFNDGRSDLFVKNATANWPAGTYPAHSRWGVVVPDSELFKPAVLPNGTLKFEHPNAVGLLSLLKEKPHTYEALEVLQPQMNATGLRDWIDLLWAGGKIAPFLPEHDVSTIERDSLRRINRERVAWATQNLSVKSQVPLLAAEYGNCLVAGWFECLILEHFKNRHDSACQKKMLDRMHKVGMAFKGPNGQAASNQLAAFKQEVDKLERNYLSKMAYWGIEI